VSTPLKDILAIASEQSGAPGAAGIVVSQDEIVDEAVVGVHRLGTEVPITLDSKFHTGSNAKAMTAAVCASLVERGLLRWETTPLDVFTELSGNILPAYRKITLEMLLRHMAGINSYTDDEAEDYVLPPLNGVPVEEYTSMFSKWLLQKLAPVNEPGTEFSYSNAGYSIAAAMAEVVSGQTWAALMQKYIFDPLDIEGVAGKGWPAKHDPAQPWGHIYKNGELVPHPPDDDYQLEEFLAPAGDVCLSIVDYGKFLQMNLNGLRGGETILTADSIRYLHNDGNDGRGLGWGVGTLKTIENLGIFSSHGGSAGTFICLAAISHQMDLAVGLFTNFDAEEFIDLSFKKIIAEYALQ
jgi:CubicO group peptidase (beta-lactamase class C family)